MTTTTSYGTWNNHGDYNNTTVEATIADVIGGDSDWRARMEASGALDRIEVDYREAIAAALPEGIVLSGEEFYGPHYTDETIECGLTDFDDGAAISEALEGVDLMAIVEAHDVDRLRVQITSFGYLHAEAPEAEITIDLRHHFRDPHVSPELRHLTAEDEAVREAVRSTPGIMPLVFAVAVAAESYLAGPSSAGRPVRVAVGCAGGRHRAASVAMELRDVLVAADVVASVSHRDIEEDVVERPVSNV